MAKTEDSSAATVRVLYARPNASTLINGIRFGVLARPKGKPAVLVSEPITAEVADHACRGMARFDPAAYPKADLAAADAQIAAERQAAADAATGGKGGAAASLEGQLVEQQQNNQRMGAALQKAKEERDVAVQKLADSSVPLLEAQVKQLAADVLEREGRIKALESENADLRRMNAELAPKDSKKSAAA